MVKSITQKAKFNSEVEDQIDVAAKILNRSNLNCEIIDNETIVVNGKKFQAVFDLESYKPDKRKKFDATIFLKVKYTGKDEFSAHLKIQLWYNWHSQDQDFFESPKTLLDFLKS